MGDKAGALRLLLLFGAASLAAVGVGAVISAMSGVPAGVWGRNLAAWAVGALAAGGLAAAPPQRIVRYLPWAALLALAATFLSAGQQGVHRWIAAGPLTINVAMLVLPATVVALAAAPKSSPWTWLAALAALLLLVLQPDASQATAFGAALAFVATRTPGDRRLKLGVLVACAGLMAAAWLPPDPLEPVPEAEEILKLAAERSTLLAGLALALLAAVAAVPALATRSSAPETRRAAAALGLLLALWIAAPFLGAFPVPLVGVGLSPVLGAWLGAGLLAATLRRPSAPSGT